MFQMTFYHLFNRYSVKCHKNARKS